MNELFFTAKASKEREIKVNSSAGLAPTLQSESPPMKQNCQSCDWQRA